MSRSYDYNREVFEACVKDYLWTQYENDNVHLDRAKGTACELLYHQHLTNYRDSFTGQRATSDEKVINNGRFRRFLENVHLVHEHNQRVDIRHQIMLNQFSDLFTHELPLLSGPDHSSNRNLWEDFGIDDSNMVHLNSYESIQSLADGYHRRSLKEKSKRHNHHHHHHHNVKLPVDPNSKWSNYLNTAKNNKLDGSQVEIKTRNHSVGTMVRTPGTQDDKNGQEDPFATSINWATKENPDGVAIVHGPTDQGACGSCWAFAATGTLEASASRRIAYDTYKTYLQNGNGDDEAEVAAKRAEKDAIRVADLSVQELIDCDTAVDQGCTGGNPLLAFYFIHRYGLCSRDDYPYVGEQDTCRARRVADPIATAQSWGILTSNHEANMEMVLRWIGPIAVGVNGSDPSFLGYKRGIYDNAGCGQGANHAMLIVGYGQEEDEDGNIIRFWIARNSWGVSWGENGYVRIKRGSGALDEPGVCGIAKNPSVAIGGVLLPNSGIRSTFVHNNGESADRSTRLEESLRNNYCDALGLGDLQTCHRLEGLMEVYPTIAYGVVSIFLVSIFVVWPLTRDCRERRRRRQLRRHYLVDQSELDEDKVAVESESLLAEPTVCAVYGSYCDQEL